MKTSELYVVCKVDIPLDMNKLVHRLEKEVDRRIRYTGRVLMVKLTDKDLQTTEVVTTIRKIKKCVTKLEANYLYYVAGMKKSDIIKRLDIVFVTLCKYLEEGY